MYEKGMNINFFISWNLTNSRKMLTHDTNKEVTYCFYHDQISKVRELAD